MVLPVFYHTEVVKWSREEEERKEKNLWGQTRSMTRIRDSGSSEGCWNHLNPLRSDKHVFDTEDWLSPTKLSLPRLCVCMWESESLGESKRETVSDSVRESDREKQLFYLWPKEGHHRSRVVSPTPSLSQSSCKIFNRSDTLSVGDTLFKMWTHYSMCVLNTMPSRGLYCVCLCVLVFMYVTEIKRSTDDILLRENDTQDRPPTPSSGGRTRLTPDV